MQLYDQQTEGITYITFDGLIKQSARARLLHYGRKDMHSSQSGQHLSVFKGRGMDFAESRLYQSGDDVRLLDWRVTARTGKPHTKVFTEEREKPVMILVDMRRPMFFATKGCFKSVLAAKIASLLCWHALQNGDKAGGVIISENSMSEIYLPSRSTNTTTRFIKELASSSQTFDFPNTASSLTAKIPEMCNILRSDAQVIVISDFRGLDEAAAEQFFALSRKASLRLVKISDPFENELLSTTKKFRLSNGQQGFILSTNAQRKYRKVHANLRATISDLAHRVNTSVIEISTDDSEAQVLLKLSRGLK